MKKICYITTTSFPIRCFFIPQLKYLSKNGYQVTVICSYDKSIQKELGKDIQFLPVNMPRGISLFGSLKSIYLLYRIFFQNKYDIIQYSTPNAALYSAVAGKLCGHGFLNYHLMGFRYLSSKVFFKIVLKLIEKFTCLLSDSIECVSKSNIELGINEHIFNEKQVTMVWNGSSGGVDLKRFDISMRDSYRREIREKYGIPEKEFVYGFVGRITRDKGVNEILKSFCKIKNAWLFMVGPVEGSETLDKNYYEKSKLNKKIIYTGKVSNVEKYFSAIDVLLLPSYREGFGNVIIEAAAMGTPSIVSNIPGPIDAVKKDETAFIVEKKNEKDLYYAMNKIRNIDYKKMGSDAYKFVSSEFDSSILNKKILERKDNIISS